MSTARTRFALRRTVPLTVAVAMIGAVLPSTGASASIAAADVVAAATAPPAREPGRGTGRFVVQLKDAPLSTFEGGPDLAATRPVAGTHLDISSEPARRYRKHLAQRRDQVRARAKVRSAQSFDVALNGFAAELSSSQVDSLRRDPHVRSVTESRMVSLTPPSQQRSTPKHPAVSDRPRASVSPNATGPAVTTRETAGSAAHGSSRVGTGKGQVIGVIDTGIWPESPSFARRLAAPAQWRGTCQTGERWAATDCNGKILGARFFADGYLAEMGALPEGEVLSARDMAGHGTHTASTSAGLRVARTVIDGHDHGSVVGVAPDARIAVYKALWAGNGTTEDLVKAIEAAVADGVDVINYSIGSAFGESSANSPIGDAFLNATLAGVFVSTAAGNDGYPGSLANTFPWVTTVAAAVTEPDEATLRLADRTTLTGLSLDPLPGSRPRELVYSKFAGSEPNSADICATGSLDRSKVVGRIVACRLGDTVATVAELREKGAAGLVLYSAGGQRFTQIHGFPTMMLPGGAVSNRLFYYLNKHPNGTTAVLTAAADRSKAKRFPSVADFSSVGPNQVDEGTLKPDVTADGVDVIAAVSPAGHAGRMFDAMSGTSMAAPHVAGMAAQLAQRHPTWTPAEISSALRTTATDTVGTTSPHQQGSGFADVDRASDPGLVFRSSAEEWFGYRDAERPDGRNLNSASLELRNYEASRTVEITRRVTNVGSRTETYTGRVQGVPGTSVKLSPTTFTIAPGKTQTIRIAVRRAEARFDRFAFGAITWSSAAHSVRIPVQARPGGVIAWNPAENLLDYTRVGWGGEGAIQPWFSGPIRARTTGFATAPFVDRSIAAGPVQGGPFDPDAPGVSRVRFTVKPGTAVVALNLRLAQQAPDGNDIDLFLYRGDQEVAWGVNGGRTEEVRVVDPTPGSYTLYVHARDATGPTIDYQLSTLLLARSANLGNADVTAPTSVVRGEQYPVKVAPTKDLPSVYHYAFVEFTAFGTTIPGIAVRIQPDGSTAGSRRP